MTKHLIAALLILGITGAMAQTKIGNITIPDSTAKAYFLDCYNNPDTLSEKSPDDGIVWHWNSDHTSAYGDPETSEEVEERKQRVSAYNKTLKNSAIGKFDSDRWLVPRKPSEEDFIKWFAKTHSK